MSILDKYIHIAICEFLYLDYKNSFTTSFISYCDIITKQITNNTISNKTLRIFGSCSKEICEIYGLDTEDSIEYLYDFFKNKYYNKFYMFMNGTINRI